MLFKQIDLTDMCIRTTKIRTCHNVMSALSLHSQRIIFYLLRYITNICFVFQKCWVQDIFAFQDVDNQPLVLSAWLSGPAARHMEQLSEEEVKQEVFQFISRLMGTALNVTVPSPALILRYCILLNTNRSSQTKQTSVTVILYTCICEVLSVNFN